MQKVLYVVLILLILIIFFRWISSKNSKEGFSSREEAILSHIVNDLEKIDPRLVQGVKYSIGTESYTDNKTHVYLCMKDENGKIYPYNVLLTVALHEGAHVLSKSVDPNHTSEEFNELHNELRKKGEFLALFDPDASFPEKYCPQ